MVVQTGNACTTTSDSSSSSNSGREAARRSRRLQSGVQHACPWAAKGVRIAEAVKQQRRGPVVVAAAAAVAATYKVCDSQKQSLSAE